MDGTGDSQLVNRRVGDRRRQRKFVLHERRTGFDRRDLEGSGAVALILQNTLVRLRDRPGRLLGLLALVNALNLADFALTLNALGSGGAEANPIMKSLFALGPIWAGVFKVVLILGASLLVWRYRSFRGALVAALMMMAIFAAVLAYHVLGLTLLR